MNYFLDTLTKDNKDNIKLKKTTSKLNKILSDEMKLYKRLAAQFVATPSNNYNAMKFWKENKSLLPNLALLTQKHLTTPSTSIKSESAFSISAYYGRKQRARLSPTNLGFSVFLKDKLSFETD